MKTPKFFCGLTLVCSLCLPIVAAPALETVLEPAQSALQQQNGFALQNGFAPQSPPMQQVVFPQVDELREQLRSIQRSNEEMQRANEQAAQKWEALAHQNASLSNVLTGLQQTLIAQKERELELGKQSNALNLRVMSGAAAAVFLVLLFSYWFQLRCFNRVMDLSRSVPALPSSVPALLENENSSSSKLLAAMRLLEQRMQHLEVPGVSTTTANSSNTTFSEMASAHTVPLLNGGPVEASSTNISLLLAKGQILLETDRLQEAVNCFQEALGVDPSNSEAHLKKGIALERMNRLDLALNAYDEALRLNPKRAIANVYKARVLAALHRYDEAISVYDSALGRNANANGTRTETPIFAS